MTITEPLLNAKLEAVEARTDTKFAELLGEIKALAVTVNGIARELGDVKLSVAALDSRIGSSKGFMIATVIGAALSIVGLTFAAVSLFASAMDATTSAYSTGAAAAQPSTPKP